MIIEKKCPYPACGKIVEADEFEDTFCRDHGGALLMKPLVTVPGSYFIDTRPNNYFKGGKSDD